MDDLFALARSQPPQPDGDFMARMLADAYACQPAAPARLAPAPSRAVSRPGVWARLAAALGGALAVAGIGSAAMAGLVIGYVQPESVVSFAGTIGFGLGESLDLLSGFDGLLSEELAP
ncbi:dihydroorotate dehydrogenase [Rhodobacter sp. ETT8]|uniref:Dihydroorotate dehydrogenase n=1 Tax=Pseudotabrizicola algicola TaxID=2709381 RepID=A0A6B3RKW8_9RHOB|nr:dihydroorotate dehydrogenase [Pseudotabrizicola algicola]